MLQTYTKLQLEMYLEQCEVRLSELRMRGCKLMMEDVEREIKRITKELNKRS